jgi:hypothetical protein
MVEVAQKTNDATSLEYYAKLEAHIKKPYRNIKKKEAAAIWDIADVGENMCRQMLSDNEKTYLVPKIQSALDSYLDVKSEIENNLRAILPKKFGFGTAQGENQ